jgi:hypothetical protein
MKVLVAVLILTGITNTGQTAAQQPTVPMAGSSITKSQERDLLKGLNSDDPAELTSTTRDLQRLSRSSPDYACDKFIIPLLHVLNDERHATCARVIAAGIFYEMRTQRGDFAIERNALFADDARVKRYCMMLARNRSMEQYASLSRPTSQ